MRTRGYEYTAQLKSQLSCFQTKPGRRLFPDVGISTVSAKMTSSFPTVAISFDKDVSADSLLNAARLPSL